MFRPLHHLRRRSSCYCYFKRPRELGCFIPACAYAAAALRQSVLSKYKFTEIPLKKNFIGDNVSILYDAVNQKTFVVKELLIYS